MKLLEVNGRPTIKGANKTISLDENDNIVVYGNPGYKIYDQLPEGWFCRRDTYESAKDSRADFMQAGVPCDIGTHQGAFFLVNT